MRVLRHFGLAEKIMESGAIRIGGFVLRDFQKGDEIIGWAAGEDMIKNYGESWW